MSPALVSELERDHAKISYRRTGTGPPLLLLPATLSTTRELAPLAERLGRSFSVISVDRRGATRTSADDGLPTGVDIADHIDDLVAVMGAESIEAAAIVGHSYGGCLALEMAARRPAAVRSVWAYEPPYAPAGPPETQRHMARVGRDTLAAAMTSGEDAAAEVFFAGVSGREALDALGAAARDRIRRAGPGAIADSTLLGLEPEGLGRIQAPVQIALGERSDAVYAAIAEGLRELITGASLTRIPDADHMAPITRPSSVAAAVQGFLGR